MDVAAKNLGEAKQGLSRLRQLTQADALQLAHIPHTWLIVAHSLQIGDLPWLEGAPDAAHVRAWQPRYRTGSTRRSAMIELGELAKVAGATGAEKAAPAKFLLRHFTAWSIHSLKIQITATLASAQNRKPREWWNKTPVPKWQNNREELMRFVSNTNVVGQTVPNISQQIIAPFRPALIEQLEQFRVEDGSPENDKSGSQIFGIKGVIRLPPIFVDWLSSQALPIAAHLVTACAWEDQSDPLKVITEVLGKVRGEYVHHTHILFGDLQRSLLGKLAMAGFPLLYWLDQGQGANPTPSLPAGRRAEFTPPEAQAFHDALHGLVFKRLQQAREFAPYETEKIAGLIKGGAKTASDLAFKHVSTSLLIAWIDSLPSLLNHSQLSDYAAGRSPAALRADIESFQNAASELKEIIHFLLAKHAGMVGAIHRKFVAGHQSYRAHHEVQDIASMIREELMKCVASFDDTVGVRFSTYGYNRITLELRRRPHAERQLIRLGADQTTALPRLWTAAQESELDADDPDYYSDITSRYNALYGKGGNRKNSRAQLTVAQVEMLLLSRTTVSLSPRDDDDDETQQFDLPDTAPLPDMSEFHELEEIVRSTLQGYTPGEEFALAILAKISPPDQALRRLNDDASQSALDGIAVMLEGRTEPSTSASGRVGRRMVPVKTCSMSTRVIRTRQGGAGDCDESEPLV